MAKTNERHDGDESSTTINITQLLYTFSQGTDEGTGGEAIDVQTKPKRSQISDFISSVATKKPQSRSKPALKHVRHHLHHLTRNLLNTRHRVLIYQR